MAARYFAFGSNMRSTRLVARVGEARCLGPGVLEGWRFVCNKRGRDGSAKANIERADDERVWGVVFELGRAALVELDRHEGGYRRVEVPVRAAEGARGETIGCQTYVSDEVASQLSLRRWYKRHIVVGAEEHRLPGSWRAMLRALPVA